ncbi:MAG: cyclic nucleotide-binding domain-containing protein [Deltaproteobacteria bacterium]|nr:cyclic nucleotide-binding domain-containing protein [Deltaproteobacteria bacterium]
MTDLQARLASLSIFKALDAEELASLAGQVQWLNIVGGWTLIYEGDEADDMFVVVSGRLGVFKRNAEGNLELIDKIGSGEIAGEMALLSNGRRSATVVALRDTELVRLNNYVFEDLASRCPKVVNTIASIVTMRLREELCAVRYIHGLSTAVPALKPSARVTDLQTGTGRPSRLESINAKPRGAHGIFSRMGEYWTVVYEEEECLIKNGKGLHYISYLLRHAGRNIHSLELVAMAEPGRGSNIVATSTLEPSVEEEVLPQLTTDKLCLSYLGDAGEMLDVRAKVAYRRRLAELHEELTEAKQHSDEDRATKAEDEIEDLTHELSRAVGLGGRDRRAASATERARLNVMRSIKIALEHFAQSSPKLGSHLKTRIKTGTFCCYRPDPDLPINWEL